MVCSLTHEDVKKRLLFENLVAAKAERRKLSILDKDDIFSFAFEYINLTF